MVLRSFVARAALTGFGLVAFAVGLTLVIQLADADNFPETREKCATYH